MGGYRKGRLKAKLLKSHKKVHVKCEACYGKMSFLKGVILLSWNYTFQHKKLNRSLFSPTNYTDDLFLLNDLSVN